MKRFWLGLGILAALLAVGLWAMGSAKAIHGSVSDQLRRAAQEQDPATAYTLAEAAKAEWEDHWYFSAAIADHGDIDRIDALFAQLEVCRDRHDEITHATLCAQLSEVLESLAASHKLSWWNLL